MFGVDRAERRLRFLEPRRRRGAKQHSSRRPAAAFECLEERCCPSAVNGWVGGTSHGTIRSFATAAESPEPLTYISVMVEGFSGYTLVQIGFSEPLNPTRAQDVANYDLSGPGGQPVRMVSGAQAKYAHLSPDGETVTVRFDRGLSLQTGHELTVVGMGPGGVTSAAGQYPVNPVTDSPGYNLTFSIPVATTRAATGVNAAAATLYGRVNPAGGATSVEFVYGTEKTLTTGTTTTAPQAIGSGASPVTVTAALTGLSPGTTYYYRVVAIATGENYTTPAAILRFKTSHTAPLHNSEPLDPTGVLQVAT